MSLQVAQVNVRSLMSNFEPFRAHVSVSAYDIVGVGETWLHADDPDDIVSIQDYTYVRQDRPDSIRGGGVGMYIKSSIGFRTIFSEYRESIEQLWVEIKCKNRIHVVGMVYRTSSSRDYETFFSTFEETLIQIHLKYDSIICLGDFNLDMLKQDSNNNVSRLLAITDTFGLKQAVNEPTRISKTSFSILDLVFTNCDYNVDIEILELNIADHCCVYSKIDLGDNETNKNKIITYRDFKCIDSNKFQDDLHSINWNIMFNKENIEEKILFFNSSVLDTLEKHAPLKTCNIYRNYAPWITPVIKKMQKLRDNALRRFKLTRNPTHWEYYKQLRNHTNNAIQSEKKAFLKQKFESCNVKQKWQELKKLNVVRKKNWVIPAHLADANSINNFFVSDNPGEPDKDILNFYEGSPCLVRDRLSFDIITPDSVSKILLNIKTNANGCDGINMNILHLCCPFLIPHITHIVNCCLSESVFPSIWKKAIVTPLPKISNPTELAHLRSISILPTLSKILEKVLEYQIRGYLDKNNLIPPKQSGFRANYSCATALSSVTDDVFKACDLSQVTVLILLDYSKAFDMIDHGTLLGILKYIGFSSGAIKLIKSYLSDRSQVVSCGGHLSEPRKIINGVPQGSILGPLMFTIYTSFFHRCLKTCQYHLYADDTQLYCSFSPSEMDDYCQRINHDLEKLFSCAQKHKLKINPVKSSVIVFGSKSHRAAVLDSCRFIMGGEIIPFKEQVKNLGLTIDNDLRFKYHVNGLLKRAYVALKMLYPHRRYLSREVKVHLCDSLVLSHFDYCDNVYGPCLDAVDIRRIQKTQNSCLRFIYGIKRPHRISYKLCETNWLNMYNRRQLHMACFFMKIIMNKTPPYLLERIQFRTDVHNVNIRRKDIITIPKHNKELFKRSFSYTAAHVLNRLNKLVKYKNDVFESYSKARKVFRQHLLDSQ